MPLDAGHLGELISLAGIKARGGRGLKVDGNAVVVTAGTVSTIIPANPKRKWALISNDSSSYCLVYLDTYASYPSQIRLEGYGHLLINADMPWTGAVAVGAPGTGPNIQVYYHEASVET